MNYMRTNITFPTYQEPTYAYGLAYCMKRGTENASSLKQSIREAIQAACAKIPLL